MPDFWKDLEKSVEKGLSKLGTFSRAAADKVEELGSTGVKKVELFQLQRRCHKTLARLGAAVYQQLVEKGAASVGKDNSEVAELLDDIGEIKKDIQAKEKDVAEWGKPFSHDKGAAPEAEEDGDQPG